MSESKPKSIPSIITSISGPEATAFELMKLILAMVPAGLNKVDNAYLLDLYSQCLKKTKGEK